ncbi:MAG: Gfo/Idh/MocA family oxidoreductase [Clostridia bacterium]|nr:Gfo/Idh/MocA family oxidoreductase [Clostridia bacterium]
MKIAICGAWHVHAKDYTTAALKTECCEILGVWESDPVLLAKFLENFPDIKPFDSFEALLASDAEGVIVCTSSDTHADCMVKIAEAKKHIFTEKVLALNVEDCLRVKEAVEKNGVDFVISLVWKYKPWMRTVKQIVDEGKLGKINYMRFRNCHGGSIMGWLPEHFFNPTQCGGGAMIDLGAHGMYITDWFMGEPAKYSSAFTLFDNNAKNIGKLEDNAVTVMTYDDGKIAVNETGFVSMTDPITLEVSGTEGFARCTVGGGVEMKAVCTEKKLVTVEMAPELPAPIYQFLTGNILEGCGMDEAIRLTKMMVGAYGNIM